MKFRVWLTAASMLLVIAGAAPANAAGKVDKPAGVKCLQAEKGAASKGAIGPECAHLETFTSASETVGKPSGVGADSVTRTRTACLTSERWLVAPGGRRLTLMWRVSTCEWFRYNGIDIIDFQNPPAITVETPSPGCGIPAPATSGAYWTDDETDPVLAWGQVTVYCYHNGWVALPVRDEFFVRHDIRPHADGTWH